MINCEYCNKEFKNYQSLGGHIKIHKEFFPKKEEVLYYKKEDDNFICLICNKKFTKINSIKFHHWRKHGEGVNHNKTRPEMKNRPTWNKNLNKNIDDRLLKSSITYKENLKSGKTKSSMLGKKLSSEHIKKLKANSGGYRIGSGRGKQGWYKDYYCHSLWELAWVIYHLDNNIKFERCKLTFDYIYQDTKRKYYPDFIIDNTIIEIKGYLTNKDLFKFAAVKQTNYNLIIIQKDKMIEIINWVELKYNRPLIELYDKELKNKKQLQKESFEIIDNLKLIENEKIKIEFILKRKELLSDIDFSKRGWLSKLSKIWNISHSQAKRYLLKYFPEYFPEYYIN